MVIRELQHLAPDIIAVQEASDSRRHGNVPDRLARALGLHVIFAPATEHLFELWPVDQVIVSLLGFKEGSAILSRFPIVASQVYALPRCQRWIERRILLRVKLATAWGPLQVYSTHAARGDECQMERVGEIVRDALSAGPSVLMGDLNIPDTSKVLTTLRHEAGFTDAFGVANPAAQGATVWQRIRAPDSTVSRRVDFILLLNGPERRSKSDPAALSLIARDSCLMARPYGRPITTACWQTWTSRLQIQDRQRDVHEENTVVMSLIAQHDSRIYTPPMARKLQSASISFGLSILMTLILASCGEWTSTRMTDGSTEPIQERPDGASVLAPAARDVDSKGGLTQDR